MLISVTKFAKVFANGSHHLGKLQRAGRGKTEIPHEALQHHLTTWGNEALDILRVKREIIGRASEEPVLFLGNHISYLDIPLLMSQMPIMFVAKKELAAWPVFGTAIRKLGMVLVDRNVPDSRARAAEAVAHCVSTRKQSVAIFPSGTTTMNEEKDWRWGAFQIAKRFDLPVQPFRLKYAPARKAAYLLEDNFVFHLLELLGVDRIEAKVEFAPVVKIHDPKQDCIRWQQWCREWVANPISK